MINQIRIQNFRSLVNVTVDLDPLTVSYRDQPSFRGLNGSIHAQVAVLPRNRQPFAGAS